MPPLPPSYRGWKSTKLHLTLIAMGGVAVAFFACGHPASLFGEFCTALITSAGLYKAASVAEKATAKPGS